MAAAQKTPKTREKTLKIARLASKSPRSANRQSVLYCAEHHRGSKASAIQQHAFHALNSTAPAGPSSPLSSSLLSSSRAPNTRRVARTVSRFGRTGRKIAGGIAGQV
ncbi:hypothetical protein [Paraburkholderia sp. Ac-20347]|uniref:hypothetical protein n=1 Tax=Paraburkholderia sp. Ac-20347 TaxID=2703892 RepID=UPI00197E6894|nr:hypothetical protein [Paraburkholderia sp. Ac-20347]MBN3814075.1 hypothetical protein [Paraburkholderia sp. Ac-20347]